MSKKLTEAQIAAQSKALGIEVASLRAVIEVECKGSGFNADGTPVILFERHVFRQRLIANGKASTADKAMRERPDLCSKSAGSYGLYSAQHGRLNAAAQYHRDSALESASWALVRLWVITGKLWVIHRYKPSSMPCTKMKPPSLMQCAGTSK